ncbi:MAG: hypothetical protein RI924_778 [Bacteroidota bacterium]|jgi:phosphoribosylformimino-5-aminoimidazole carboxamide ribotide isomerase
MRIIPAIDLINGKCVRLSKGAYETAKIYHENPLELAKEMEDHGIQYLHLVDLDGAKAHTVQNHRILYEIATKTNLIIDFGGGIKTRVDLELVFSNGAGQVTLGSMAINDPELFMECLSSYGAERIMLGADCRNRKIATQGWLEHSEIDVLDFIRKYFESGVQYVVCTDIARDGMLSGAANELYQEILSSLPLNLIASGGVSCMNDLKVLKSMACEGAIVGKALYEGRITLKQLSDLC